MNWFAGVALALILAKLAAELWLAALNRRHVLAHGDRVPDGFKDTVDETTYAKSVQYTLARSRFWQYSEIFSTVILIAVLFSGILPWGFKFFYQPDSEFFWKIAAFPLAVWIALWLPTMPWGWVNQFRLEEKFGFNTTTQKTWWLDRVKGLLLGFVLGYGLVMVVIVVVQMTGDYWWLWAWGTFMVIQLLMAVIGPLIILPLFNKFTPLPEGTLHERLKQLAERTQFRARRIQVMDASRRSRHSNAFFIGIGKFRKIVLYDTLIAQLSEPELEAVLAHEIGHYKKKHIPKMLITSAIGLFLAFYALAWLARQEWFYRGFGFEPGGIVPALVLFVLLADTITFWLSPVLHAWSRRYEYQADAYAANVMNEPRSMIGALRKLSEKNLSNLTPHPLYSGFYYSHPTLLERERALAT